MLPPQARATAVRGERLGFHDGVRYRPCGPRCVVIDPPFGVVVPAMPAFAMLIVAGGVRYDCANDARYR